MLGSWERVLTPAADEHRFTEACFALSSGTRVAILMTLTGAREPMHIREIARRVGLDPSPVRQHLEVLVKSSLAREIPEPGRERRFVADVSDVRLFLVPPDRPSDVPPSVAPTKAIHKLTDKMLGIEEKIHRLQRDLAALADERVAVWRDAAEDEARERTARR